MEPVVLISLNLVLILRLLLAFFWGWSLALFLQFTHIGKFWAEERTWLTVVIGVGVDWLISYDGSALWWTMGGILATSAVGILARSWHNENRDAGNPRLPNKTQWSLDAANTYTQDMISILSRALSETDRVAQIGNISNSISLAHQIQAKIIDARRGAFSNGKAMKGEYGNGK